MTYMPRPSTRAPAPGVMTFIISLDSSLVNIVIYLVCLIYAWEYRKILKEIMHFHYMTYMATP